MQIEMITTSTGSPDGIHVETYHAQHVYDLPPVLAGCFLAMGVGREYGVAVEPAAVEPEPAPQETKVAAPPETKPAPRGRKAR
jgi:hypothetical protein